MDRLLTGIKFFSEDTSLQEQPLEVNDRVFHLDSRNVAIRIVLSIAAAIVLGVGVRLAYTAYRTEKILQVCISGGSCPYNETGFQLGSMLSATRGQLYIGLGLAALGLVALVYFVLLVGISSRTI